MGGEAVPLSVVPAALYGASAVVGGQAVSLGAAPAATPTSLESAGQAGAAVNDALQAYRSAFGQRMSTMADGLTGAAGAYTNQEAANSQALAALSPTRWV